MLTFIKRAFEDYWDIQNALAEQGIYEMHLPCYPYFVCSIDTERLKIYYDKQRAISESNRPIKD